MPRSVAPTSMELIETALTTAKNTGTTTVLVTIDGSHCFVGVGVVTTAPMAFSDVVSLGLPTARVLFSDAASVLKGAAARVAISEVSSGGVGTVARTAFSDVVAMLLASASVALSDVPSVLLGAARMALLSMAVSLLAFASIVAYVVRRDCDVKHNV